MKVTSMPEAAIRAPKYPPTAPAPITATRMFPFRCRSQSWPVSPEGPLSGLGARAPPGGHCQQARRAGPSVAGRSARDLQHALARVSARHALGLLPLCHDFGRWLVAVRHLDMGANALASPVARTELRSEPQTPFAIERLPRSVQDALHGRAGAYRAAPGFEAAPPAAPALAAVSPWQPRTDSARPAGGTCTPSR